MKRTASAFVASAAVGCVAAVGLMPAAASDKTPDSPKNVIYMIGDGLGYNHVANTNFYETGQSDYQVDVNMETGEATTHEGEPVQVYEHFKHVGMTTYQLGGEYSPEGAWSDFDNVSIEENVTDSAAAGTAMATGTKVENGSLNVSPDGEVHENLSQLADDTDRAAGVVSSVPYSHATPAAFSVANADRNQYGEIARDQIDADYLDVVMGPGHPYYDDSNQPLETPDFGYIDEQDFDRLSNGQTDWSYIETEDQFDALAEAEDGDEVPEKVFGIPQVGSTLQQGREGTSDEPYGVPFNEDVPSLDTMTEAALNVLEQDEDGFSLMAEGGAIDWTGHDNDEVRNIEETQDFNDAVESVVEWVEEESSWEETLVVVTADHETGYLSGPGGDPHTTAMTSNGEGEIPNLDWYSTEHTNMLVPFFYKGAGSEHITGSTVGEDPIRGEYIDNTTLANLLFDDLWAEEADKREDKDGGEADDRDENTDERERDDDKDKDRDRDEKTDEDEQEDGDDR